MPPASLKSTSAGFKKISLHAFLILMQELDITEHVAQKWTCGKPTAWLNPLPLTLVKLKDNIGVKAPNAETMLLTRGN